MLFQRVFAASLFLIGLPALGQEPDLTDLLDISQSRRPILQVTPVTTPARSICNESPLQLSLVLSAEKSILREESPTPIDRDSAASNPVILQAGQGLADCLRQLPTAFFGTVYNAAQGDLPNRAEIWQGFRANTLEAIQTGWQHQQIRTLARGLGNSALALQGATAVTRTTLNSMSRLPQPPLTLQPALAGQPWIPVVATAAAKAAVPLTPTALWAVAVPFGTPQTRELHVDPRIENFEVAEPGKIYEIKTTIHEAGPVDPNDLTPPEGFQPIDFIETPNPFPGRHPIKLQARQFFVTGEGLAMTMRRTWWGGWVSRPVAVSIVSRIEAVWRNAAGQIKLRVHPLNYAGNGITRTALRTQKRWVIDYEITFKRTTEEFRAAIMRNW